MSKHTPGPWVIGNYDKLTILNETRELRIAAADFQTRHALGNAQLIAAAPDLLEACRQIIECDDTAARLACRAALAKAGV